MKNLVVIILMTTLGNLDVQAMGHENEGPAYCRWASYICSTDDQDIRACAFSNQVFIVARDVPHSIEASLVPQSEGVKGAGIIYQGADVTLHIESGLFHPGQNGFKSFLTAPSLELNSLEMTCVPNSKNQKTE